jgi:hypothetical protein
MDTQGRCMRRQSWNSGDCARIDVDDPAGGRYVLRVEWTDGSVRMLPFVVVR